MKHFNPNFRILKNIDVQKVGKKVVHGRRDYESVAFSQRRVISKQNDGWMKVPKVVMKVGEVEEANQM